MSIQLNERLPILEIDQDCILSKRGEASVVYELSKPELFSLSAEELANQHAAWTKAIGLLPNGVTLTLQDWYTQASFQVNFEAEKAFQYLARKSDYHFHERPYFSHRCFCIFTFRLGKAKKPSSSALSSLLRRSLAPELVVNPAKLTEVVNHCQRFMLLLSANSTIRYRRLTGEELAGTTEQRGLLEQYLQLEPCTKRLRLQDIQANKSLRVGKKYTMLYTLADAEHLPPQVSPFTRFDSFSNQDLPFPIGFGTPLGPLLPVDHIYSQYMVKDNPAETLKKMETGLRRLKSLGGNSRENLITQEAVSEYLQQAAKGDQTPIKAHFNILAWTEDETITLAIDGNICRAISRIGAVPHLETVGAPQIWWAGLPGNAGDLPMNETFDTFVDQAVCFFIPESNGVSSKSPFGIRLGDRATGIPLHVDISDEPMLKGMITNRNKFILGGSGSGKSFFTNHLLRSYHDQGAHIVLVDIGGSYKGLCELLGGRYFAYNEDQTIQFNPFYLPEGYDLEDTEKREGLKSLLLTLWKKSEETFRRSEYVALSNILEDYYGHLQMESRVFPCFDSFYEWFRDSYVPVLEFSSVREKDFDCANFLYVLRPYYKGGEFDKLLNAREEMDLLQERFIVFDLDRIKDHPILFPIVTIVIMEVFIGKMRRLHGSRKVILLDEAWKAIIAQGEFIKYLYKTVRKYFGEAIVVTQDIEDIVSSPVVKNTIINNADCKILLDQSKFMNRFREIQEVLGLMEKDKLQVLSLNKANDPALRYKEVFISLGSGHSRVYRTEVSLEEYLVYTTEETQKVKVNEYAKRYGSIRHGINMLAADIRSGAVKLLVIVGIAMAAVLLPNGGAKAQIIDIAEEVVKEALETADLKIQQLQTQTLYLQNAEKALENSMAGDLLDDITGWVQQQDQLFAEYYQELWQVKATFSTYSKVARLIERQTQLVKSYQQVTAAVQHDPHFSAAEVHQMLTVYSGILNASIRNTGELALVIQSFMTRMDDEGRLRIIDETAAGIDRNYADLQQYNQQNTLLSLQRAKEAGDIATIKALYGIQ